MEIEPIAAISEVSAATPLALHPTPESVLLTPLAQAKAKEAETTEDLADDGDPVAETQLLKEEQRHIPIAAQQLLPIHAEHVAGHDEPGKGVLIDIYD